MLHKFLKPITHRVSPLQTKYKDILLSCRRTVVGEGSLQLSQRETTRCRKFGHLRWEEKFLQTHIPYVWRSQTYRQLSVSANRSQRRPRTNMNLGALCVWLRCGALRTLSVAKKLYTVRSPMFRSKPCVWRKPHRGFRQFPYRKCCKDVTLSTGRSNILQFQNVITNSPAKVLKFQHPRCDEKFVKQLIL